MSQIEERPILQQPQNIIQSKTISKILVLQSSQLHDKVILVLDYVIPQRRSGDDSISRTIKGKPYRMLEGKFQLILIQFIGPLLNQLKYPYRKFLESLQI